MSVSARRGHRLIRQEHRVSAREREARVGAELDDAARHIALAGELEHERRELRRDAIQLEPSVAHDGVDVGLDGRLGAQRGGVAAHAVRQGRHRALGSRAVGVLVAEKRLLGACSWIDGVREERAPRRPERWRRVPRRRRIQWGPRRIRWEKVVVLPNDRRDDGTRRGEAGIEPSLQHRALGAHDGRQSAEHARVLAPARNPNRRAEPSPCWTPQRASRRTGW